ETDIREKNEKSSQNGQNRARNGKEWKSQSQQVKVKVNPEKSTVKAETKTEETLNGPTCTQLMGRITQPGMNTSQDIKMKMVDDDVENQVRQNAV
ncbi:hypothetical protein Tco_1268154, partial [Tanacetum coccineum]